MIRTVSVGRAPGYDVLIGPRLMDRAGERLVPFAPSGRVVIVADPVVAEHHGERLAAAIEAAPLSADFAVDGKPPSGFGAGDLVLLFGGDGVAADPAILRAGRIARMPTTLSAQATCVPLDGAPAPVLILADLDVLATLEAPQVRTGYAEVLKHALAADARLFGWLEAHGRCVTALQAPELAHAIGGCVDIRARTAAERLALGDPFAVALAVEAGGSLSNADAIGLGCALAFQLASTLGLCNADHAERATWNLAAAGLAVRLEAGPGAPYSARSLATRVERASAPGLTLTLPIRLGETARVAVEREALNEFLISEGALP
jgi:3-dehydroquinate synthase